MTRLEREKRTIRQMIELYCHHKEQNATLCDSCRELLTYAEGRLDQCRYGLAKVACKSCPTHCYTAARREQIRTVMRYAGPWMLLYHPLAALRHLMKP